MKKIYSLSLLMAVSLSFAQTPIITGVMDGPCTGGHPKAVEIYANGTVDFANYSLENQSNANTTWGNTLNLASFGTVTDDFIYIVSADTNTSFSSEFADVPSSHIFYTSTENGEPAPVSINGDDRVRIIDVGMTVIDQYGEEGVDGSETTWEYLDSWARRVDGTGPNGGTFNADNWTYGGVDALDGLGLCNAEAALSTIVPFGQYNATASVQQNSISTLKMFPNPLSGSILNITSNANATKVVAIYDVLGKQVVNTVTKNGTINVSGLTSGVYIVKITEEGKTATRKLVVK
ncbi:T9SS C-terminal target domain-containing protein [Flavobacterium arcticum]|uniref:T9SS C-terminal target domain-containing protein n=1 Tax=Flavobacterium arcticum TaxID=1784713 RepID=A0A345HA46_9FLAO|nr:T9SS type A sorting domain-containing protein [Flavobacterium arcticum]AXG73456.1 T9SS C-terminal target domain-containing protein [Flavobacterium arcticum]KAF2513243.1 T9SS type A sorting domain-containing protein [Flavobacterium arcticum]